MRNYRDEIHKNAQLLRTLYYRIYETFTKSPHSSEHHTACMEFHNAYDRLAFPGGLRVGLAALKRGDTTAVEVAIIFLELGEYFHRSGYIKEDLLRHLKHLALSAPQQGRLIACTCHSFFSGGRREAKLFARLTSYFGGETLHCCAMKAANCDMEPEAQRRARYYLSLTSMHGRKRPELTCG